jgi:hypothetical protein
MEARNNLTLLDLPADIINAEACQWLTLENLLRLSQTSKKCREHVNTFVQNTLPKIPLQHTLNNEYNHFIYLYYFIKKNPAILQSLQSPEKLLALCIQLSPKGLLRLSILFSIFNTELHQPLEAAATLNNSKWLTAFACHALFTTDIKTLDLHDLQQAIWWLNMPENKETYAAINPCLITIKKILRAHPSVEVSDLPNTLCYLNLQGALLLSARLGRAKLNHANLGNADMRHAELLRSMLYGAYMKNTQFRDSDLLDTRFFDLKDSEVTLLNQLDMLDYQLAKTEHSSKLDEAITTDLLTQIKGLKTREEKEKALQTARTHHFFASRLDNINLRIAFTQASHTLAQPSTTCFFQLPKLRSVRDSTAAEALSILAPKPSQ